MWISFCVPFATSAVLALLAPQLARRIPPREAVWSLTCAALVAAGGWAGALALLAFTGFGQIPLVAAQGPWSVRALHAADPATRSVAAVCGLALAACAVALGIASWRRGRLLVQAYRECRRLPGDSELAVIDDASLEAFALPGAPGRVVVSTGMLRALEGAEREALMAHERAHLRHRHHLFLFTLQVAAAACPLLHPLAKEGAYAVERWADEEAAASVGDRTVVARALARVSLARKKSGRSLGILAATGGPVPRRVRALLAAAPERRRLPLAVGGLLVAMCCVSLAVAARSTEKLFETAMHAYLAGRY